MAKTKSNQIKLIDIGQFVDGGYLQEVNRRFFHPLGMALEVIVDDESGSVSLGGIWDYRDDPEGICFGPDEIEPEKYKAVQAEWSRKREARLASLGYMVQPVEGVH